MRAEIIIAIATLVLPALTFLAVRAPTFYDRIVYPLCGVAALCAVVSWITWNEAVWQLTASQDLALPTWHFAVVIAWLGFVFALRFLPAVLER